MCLEQLSFRTDNELLTFSRNKMTQCAYTSNNISFNYVSNNMFLRLNYSVNLKIYIMPVGLLKIIKKEEKSDFWK